MKAAALKDFSPYVAKVKAQSAGDVNRVLPALKTMQQLKTIETILNY
jgi:peptidyl-prolyl cis-trans isomerase D